MVGGDMWQITTGILKTLSIYIYIYFAQLRHHQENTDLYVKYI